MRITDPNPKRPTHPYRKAVVAESPYDRAWLNRIATDLKKAGFFQEEVNDLYPDITELHNAGATRTVIVLAMKQRRNP